MVLLHGFHPFRRRNNAQEMDIPDAFVFQHFYCKMVGEIAMLLCYEATRNLELEDVEIETPICITTVKALKGKKLAVSIFCSIVSKISCSFEM